MSRNTQFIGTYLVTGLYERDEYMHCTTERSDHGICGVNATRYKKKYIRKNKLNTILYLSNLIFLFQIFSTL